MSFDGGCAGSPAPSPRHGRRAVDEDRAVCVGLDTHKARIAVAVAEPGRAGEVRFRGEIANRPDAVRRLLERLAERHGQLRVCYEAGPCGYGLQRQITALGHDCTVVAPSLVPRRPGERVKTNRRDALTLARLHRAGELTAIWIPDPTHEAMRDLVRARTAALQAMRGIAFLSAVVLAAEVGDFRRFANPCQLMAWLGLVPSEHSSGAKVERGGVTKAGNGRARRVLVEGAWSYRFPAR